MILLLKIIFPTIDNNRLVLFNNRFNKQYIMFLKTMIIALLYRIDIVFSFMPIFQYMYVDGCMVIAVEHESEPEENEYSRHYVSFLQI